LHFPTGLLLDYDKENKKLYFAAHSLGHEFPSKRKAQIAIWHTVQKSGKPGSHVDYRIEEV